MKKSECDAHVLRHIAELLCEHDTVRIHHPPTEAERLRELERELDQCWRILREPLSQR